MTSTRSMEGKGLHFPPSFTVDDYGVIVVPPEETLPAIAAAVEPSDLIFFAQRLIKGTRRKRHLLRWSRVNEQRMILARLCLARAIAEPAISGLAWV